MTTFTKEQLQQIEAAAKEVLWPVVWSEKKAREHFSEKITPEVVLELARIALASLEAEPVAWRYRHHNGLAPSNWRFVDSEDECNMAPNYQRQALYAAPPEPVVSQEAKS
ncbi:hypothetical protein [Citrobacter amalonaticus]|uniref:hypothetical protein n=1 Tax=Citrobacter amalonaticus TaxID=35703 RepID=UPI000A3A0DD6|nr:hypothetical protein [Citrobacter amalonaticus]OUE50307.1 hypothetical protein AZ012_004700 [Citrobacter amalonaticus]